MPERACSLGTSVRLDSGVLRHPALLEGALWLTFPTAPLLNNGADARLFVLLARAVADLRAAGRIRAGNGALAARVPSRSPPPAPPWAVPAGHLFTLPIVATVTGQHIAYESPHPMRWLHVMHLLGTQASLMLLQPRAGRWPSAWPRSCVSGGGLRLLRDLVHLGMVFLRRCAPASSVFLYSSPMRAGRRGFAARAGTGGHVDGRDEGLSRDGSHGTSMHVQRVVSPRRLQPGRPRVW